ncbi:hypothetical protein HQ571_06585 [Candidatus Kuenenbacteria bacterium]|nr:hypothetical protein [Candidatus Kuenenbacteria bacterium]
MGVIRVALNGFGRIGQRTARMIWENPDCGLEIVAINELYDAAWIKRRIERDSVYGKFQGEVSIEQEGACLCVNGKYVYVYGERAIADLPWLKLKVDLVIDATGVFMTYDQLEAHLLAGAKKVLLTAPTKDERIPMIVNGVNSNLLLSAKELNREYKIVSNASCTTNCIAPLCWIIHKIFGIESGFARTIHAATPGQKVFDSMGSKKDPRRNRCTGRSIIPTSTGAAAAIGIVIPVLAGLIDGEADRVPLDTGSSVILDFDLVGMVEDKQELNRLIQEEIRAFDFQDIVQFLEDEQYVSCDVTGENWAAVVSGDLTRVRCNGKKISLRLWYDNEMGYTHQLLEIAKIMCS